MSVEISHDDVIGDVAGCGREVAALPEALAPVALSDVFELLLDLARRAPLGTTYEVTDRDVRRDFNEHVHVIARQDVNRRSIGTPYRRAKGTPLLRWWVVDAGRGFRAAGGVGRA
jgi:hypothetical protein